MANKTVSDKDMLKVLLACELEKVTPTAARVGKRVGLSRAGAHRRLTQLVTAKAIIGRDGGFLLTPAALDLLDQPQVQHVALVWTASDGITISGGGSMSTT